MKGKDYIEEAFKEKKERMKATLSAKKPHATEKGNSSENIWIDFFKEILPHRYKVDKGFVFDSMGNISQQIDIIIYDALYSPLIAESNSGDMYITAESVYAVFEVKSKIDKGNIEYAVDKINSVKNLHRTSRSMTSSGNRVGARKLTKIIGGILAFNSVSLKTLEGHLQKYKDINIGCALNNCSFISYQNEDVDLFTIVENDIIMSFYFMIFELLFIQGTVPAIDIREYSKMIIPELKWENS